MAKDRKPRLTKEDLDARFAAQQEKNRARRQTKVTREDVEKRLAERKARKAEKTVTGRRGRVLSLSLGIVLLVGSGALAVATSSSTAEFTLATEINEQQIAALKGTLEEIPAADDQAAGEYATELEAQIEEATRKGDEVAALQQGFVAILSEGSPEAGANGAPSPTLQNWAEHRRLLTPYFVDRSLFVDEVAAYAPGSVFPFEDDEIDPRFPWYQPANFDPASTSWRLASVVATSTPGVLEATWLNENPATGDLLAWATASYYSDGEAFGGLTVGQTTLGERASVTNEKDGE